MQCGKRVDLGQLLGPNLEQYSLDDISLMLSSSTHFHTHGITNIQLETRVHKLSARMETHEPRVPTVHIMVDATQKRQAKLCFKHAYPSLPKARGPYPLGVQYRFVEEIISGDTPVLPNKRKRIMNLRNKQKAFNNSLRIMNYEGIKSLHRPLPGNQNITLLKFLAAMKSTKYPEQSLFVAIEQEHSDATVNFYYKSNTDSDIRVTVPALPLIIAGHFGQLSAKEWFRQECWAPVDEFEFEFLD
jgi:hypothetical protein